MSDRSRSIETVIVGAGQAGLIVSRLLSEAGREHVLFDRRATLGGGWQDRWDAFRLVSPNWTTSVPGFDYQGDAPDAFMPRDELIAHFRAYAAAIAAPVELDTEVVRLVQLDDGAARFRISTNRGTFDARNVVVAGGPFQVPRIPAIATGFDRSIVQVHSHDYRNADQLPDGGVLLVGSGQTGVQLAEELRAAGRDVTLSAGRCGRAPRRYRGRDIFWWLRQLAMHGTAVGTPLPSADRLPSPAARFVCNPQLSGHGGGRDVDLRRMAAGGIRVVGRLIGADGTRAGFATDLTETLQFVDGWFGERLQPLFDGYAAATGQALPTEVVEASTFAPPEVAELDLPAAGIRSVLWTSGYRPAFDWIEIPVLDDFTLPRQIAGATDVPGLAFVGTPWLVDMGSANLIAVVRDAQTVVEALIPRE
jgi:putative flavoprotein involved in K+ transport